MVGMVGLWRITINGVLADSGLTGGIDNQDSGGFGQVATVQPSKLPFVSHLPLDVVSLNYESGDWEDENSFEIISSSGEVLFSDGPYIDTTPQSVAQALYVDNADDCNDTSTIIWLGAPEICDGLDNNCDTIIDEGLNFFDYYVDSDGDGYGDANGPSISSCDLVNGAVDNNLDCNDSERLAWSGATEICDSIDNDCNGTIDDEPMSLDYYPDRDGDLLW